MNKAEIVAALQTGAHNVGFIKKDGSFRLMTCTLEESALPSGREVTTDRKQSDDAVIAYDLDKGAFRTFRVDSVKSFEKL